MNLPSQTATTRSPFVVEIVANAVQANLLSATISNPEAKNQVYNVAVGDRTTLNILFAELRNNLSSQGVSIDAQPLHRDFRAGDVRHSQADISKPKRLLGYSPTHSVGQGVQVALDWYVENQSKQVL